MNFTLHNSIRDLDAAQWNRLAEGAQPFLRHEFLAALEAHRAVGGDSGWQPCYLVAERQGRLHGAVPMYLKEHSFGEFVFDWAWAGAYERHGLPYYPKLVVAVPYTPVTGRRILIAPDSAEAADLAANLIESALQWARDLDVSSLHWLFTTAEDTRLLRNQGLMLRTGCQFHWENPGYADFEDFLDALSSRSRKEVRRERRSIMDQGIRVDVIHGADATEETWDALYRFYRSTFLRKGNYPPLTPDFFRELGDCLGDATLLIMASLNDDYIGGALFFLGGDALFGRHWGADGDHPNLHFELCYYRPIEYCIERGIRRFEAGAQGEYKVRRGFRPTLTRSMHWIGEPRFEAAIGDFLEQERCAVDAYLTEMQERLPYRVTT